jgi:YVTN family beta-propeller protein
MGTVSDLGPAGLAFAILGPLHVVRDGQTVPLGGARQRAVLARLLVEPGRTVSLAGLADAVWGEAVPPGYATTLQTYVFHLRAALEPEREHGAAAETLVTDSGGYRLAVRDGALDAGRFEELAREGRRLLDGDDAAAADDRLSEALALWRGPVLADLAEFDFVSPVSTRLEQLRLDATEARLGARLALGRHGEVAAEASDLVRQHPLREQLHALHMLALFRCGRQGEALAAYTRLRRQLIDELGIEPSPQVRELHAKILAQDPSLDWIPPAEPQRSGDQAQPPRPQTAAWRARPRRRQVFAAGAAIVVAVGVAATVVLTHHGTHHPIQISGDDVAALRADGTIRKAIQLETAPEGLAVHGDEVWVANTNDSTVSRINGKTGAVEQRLPLGPTAESPVAVAVLGDEVWVANANSANVSEISTATGQVVDTVPVGHHPSAIAAGFGRLWVTNAGDATVSVIDPSHYPRRATPVDVGTEPDAIAVGADAVWVANRDDNTVSRIDPTTLAPGGAIPVGAGPAAVAVAGTAVWVADSLDETVTRIDPQTLTRTINMVGDVPISIAAFAGTAWVATAADGRLERLNPSTGQVSRSYSLGASPQAFTATPSTLWLSTQSFVSPSHRGGTLTVSNTNELITIDPATAYGGGIPAVYDTLVTNNHADGSAGFELVPDLARSLPIPTATAGGTVYTFTLRPGIHYSTGRLVRAEDFRRGLERSIPLGSQFGEPLYYYAGIIGAGACLAHPDRPCDLSQGIRTDNHAGTVTYRLTQPDPDFEAKLATSDWAAPVPPGTPTGNAGSRPIPGTGPYQISDYQPKTGALTLTRNNYFHVWSTAAQPPGYPDRIRYVSAPNSAAAVKAVQDGHADIADLGQTDVTALRVSYPGQVSSGPVTGTYDLALNAHVPPFNNPLARRAVAEAFTNDPDLSRILGGTPSCSQIPPDWPGAPAQDCAGLPNRTLATQLVGESGTRGMTVHVNAVDWPPLAAEVRYVTKVLNTIGYHAIPSLTGRQNWAQQHNDMRSRTVDVEASGWYADFPAASQFYQPLLSCPASQFAVKTGCNDRLDRLAERALNTQITDPATAQRLWQQLYIAVAADARFVATTSSPLDNVFESPHLGNIHFSAFAGFRDDQLWVH